jgi:hypothetical protein
MMQSRDHWSRSPRGGAWRDDNTGQGAMADWHGRVGGERVDCACAAFRDHWSRLYGEGL